MSMEQLYNTASFIEVIIKALFRDKNVLKKAIDLEITENDFGTIDLYRLFVSIALQVREAPINPKLCLAHIKTGLSKYSSLALSQEKVVDFWAFIYNDEPVNADYITSNLVEFLKFRRYQMLKSEHIHNPEELVQKANRLVNDTILKDKSDGVREFIPFQNLVLTTQQEMLSTGFNSIDSKGKGLCYQELGLIIGHSGSGKTATAVFSAIQNAKQHRKVLYLSLEEPGENICNRVYSNIFRINYSNLHRGCAATQYDLSNAFENQTDINKAQLAHLRIHDLRNATPITANYLKDYLDKLYETTGYHPDIVYIDQLDYVTSNQKADSQWQKYSNSIFEIDDLCNHLIGGQHKFAVWLIHQAAGKMQKSFTNSEISGFKGILKPVDLCLAIGRDSPQDKIVNIFSLKCRHSENFGFSYFAELEYMNFEEHTQGAEERMSKDAEGKIKQRTGGFKNVPNKFDLLPSATSGFKATY